MGQRRNHRLAALIATAGYTHPGLAEEVNRGSERLAGRPGDCTDRHVRRWISGEVRWPHARYRLPLETIFGRPAVEMGFVPRGRTSTRPVPPPPRSAQEEGPVIRRRFLTASTATTVAGVLRLDETPSAGRFSMTDMARVHDAISRLDAHFFAIGGGPLLAVATEYAARLRTALDTCTYGDRVETALHTALSGLYASAGWAAHDSGRPAQDLHAASLQSALLARDPLATARAWSNLALQARLSGRHREAVQITRAALAARPDRRSPHLAALLHARLAIGQARTADPRGAARSILAAQQAFDRVTADQADAWLAFLTAAELSGLAAIAHQALGRYDHAEAATADALDLLAPAMRRSRAYYGVQLAELQLARGERELASATAAAVDSSSLDSPRIGGRLTAIHRTLTA